MVEVMKSQRRTSNHNSNNGVAPFAAAPPPPTASSNSRSHNSTEIRRAGGRRRPDNAVRVSSSNHANNNSSSSSIGSSRQQQQQQQQQASAAVIARVDLRTMDMTMNMLTGGGGASGGSKTSSSNTTGMTFQGILSDAALEQSLLMIPVQQPLPSIPKSPRKSRRQRNLELQRSDSCPQELHGVEGKQQQQQQPSNNNLNHSVHTTSRQAPAHIERKTKSFHMRRPLLDNCEATATRQEDGSSSTHASRAELLEQQGGLRRRCFSDSGDEVPQSPRSSQRRERSTNAFKEQAACFSQAYAAGGLLPASQSTGRRASSSHPLLHLRKRKPPPPQQRRRLSSHSADPATPDSVEAATKQTPTTTIATTDPLHDPRYNANHEKCRMLFRQSRETTNKKNTAVVNPSPRNNVHSPWHYVEEPQTPIDKKSKYKSLLKGPPNGRPNESQLEQPKLLPPPTQPAEERKPEPIKQPRESTRERIRREAAARRPKTPQSAGTSLRRQRLNRQGLSAPPPLIEDPAILSTPAKTRQRLRLSARQRSARGSVKSSSTSSVTSSTSVTTGATTLDDDTTATKSDINKVDEDENSQKVELEKSTEDSAAVPQLATVETSPPGAKEPENAIDELKVNQAAAATDVHAPTTSEVDREEEKSKTATQTGNVQPTPTAEASAESSPMDVSVAKMDATVVKSETEETVDDVGNGKVVMETETGAKPELNEGAGASGTVGVDAGVQDRTLIAAGAKTEVDTGISSLVQDIEPDLMPAREPEPLVAHAVSTQTMTKSVAVDEKEGMDAGKDRAEPAAGMEPPAAEEDMFSNTNSAGVKPGARRQSRRGSKKATTADGETAKLRNGATPKKRESRRSSRRTSTSRKVTSGLSSSSSNIKHRSTEEELLAFFQTSAALRMQSKDAGASECGLEALGEGGQTKKKKSKKGKVTFDSTVIRYEGEVGTSSKLVDGPKKKPAPMKRKKRRKKGPPESKVASKTSGTDNELSSSSGTCLEDDSDSAGEESGASRRAPATARKQKKEEGSGERVSRKKTVKKQAPELE